MGKKLPMPNAQCPMPNAQCPMPNAQCPMPNAPSGGAVICREFCAGYYWDWLQCYSRNSLVTEDL
ncbi:hypothetical protein IQ246_25475 [aff. Roholtiella sp. LEGE 12411]|nr:hypothetical protein [aff. Roholtiella sp. LEGE 12411]